MYVKHLNKTKSISIGESSMALKSLVGISISVIKWVFCFNSNSNWRADIFFDLIRGIWLSIELTQFTSAFYTAYICECHSNTYITWLQWIQCECKFLCQFEYKFLWNYVERIRKLLYDVTFNCEFICSYRESQIPLAIYWNWIIFCVANLMMRTKDQHWRNE